MVTQSDTLSSKAVSFPIFSSTVLLSEPKILYSNGESLPYSEIASIISRNNSLCCLPTAVPAWIRLIFELFVFSLYEKSPQSITVGILITGFPLFQNALEEVCLL